VTAELPYMPLFVHDVLAEIADLDDAERGAYVSLLFGLWAEGGSLPLDPRRLARRAGTDPARWDAIWSVISRFFVVANGAIAHAMVTSEMARAREQRDARRRGADATNAQRSAKRHAQRDAQRTVSVAPSETHRDADCDTPPSPSPSPSPDPSQQEAEESASASSGSTKGPDPDLCLESFREARAEAIGRHIPVREGDPARDVHEFREKVAALPTEPVRVRAAARLFFCREGNGPGDQFWKDGRWSLHLFTSQALDVLLPEVEADERRRQHRQARAHEPRPAPKRVPSPREEWLAARATKESA
jgi:uncharacterized protein YdaU (DUF1376 family)